MTQQCQNSATALPKQWGMLTQKRLDGQRKCFLWTGPRLLSFWSKAAFKLLSSRRGKALYLQQGPPFAKMRWWKDTRLGSWRVPRFLASQCGTWRSFDSRWNSKSWRRSRRLHFFSKKVLKFREAIWVQYSIVVGSECCCCCCRFAFQDFSV